MGNLWRLLILALTFLPISHANVHKIIDFQTSFALMNQISNDYINQEHNIQSEDWIEGVPRGILETRNYGDTPFCFSVDGHSIGSKHFSKNEFKYAREGLAAFQAGPPGAWLHDASYMLPNTQDDLLKVAVHSIQVDGKVLEGWFHITVELPENVKNPFYAVVIQVEDDITRRAVGEFTTELMDLCEEESNNGWSPTQTQLLPCHATWRTQAVHSNAMVYWANADPNIIQSQNTRKIHTNWKIPPGFGCSYINKYFVRVDAMALPTPDTGHRTHEIYPTCTPASTILDGAAYTGQDCKSQPLVYTSERVTIQMPGISKTKEFHVADPAPQFLSKDKVECHGDPSPAVVVQRDPIVAKDCKDEVVKLAVSYRQADYTHFKQYFEFGGHVFGLKDLTVCRPHFADVHLGPCVDSALQLMSKKDAAGNNYFTNGPTSAFYFTNAQRHAEFHFQVMTRQRFYDSKDVVDLKEYADLRSRLYLGRCKGFEKGTVTKRTVVSEASFPLICELHKGKDYDDDNKYINDLPTANEYLTNMKRDMCNCDPDGDDGALKIPEVARVPTPKSNRPIGPDGGRNLLGGGSNETEPKSPKEKLERRIKRARNFHAFFIILATLFFTPLGVFIARYLKETFHGKTLSTYDVWYTLHLICVGLAFWCLVYGLMVTFLCHPAGDAMSDIHVAVAVLVILVFLVAFICGGIRYAKSEKSLKISIIFHAAVGSAFYVLGVICIVIPLAGQAKDQNMLIALCLVILRVVIDLIFHVVMTLRVRKMDQELKLKGRPLFPVALVITDRDAPDKKFRVTMFWAYLVVTFVVVVGIIGLIFLASLPEDLLGPELMEKYREKIKKPEHRH